MNIMLVDDDAVQLEKLGKIVHEVAEGADIRSYTDPAEACGASKERIIDLAFLDIEMAGLNGIQLAKKIQGTNPHVNIIFVTDHENYAYEAIKMRASGYVLKPATKAKIDEELKNLRNPVIFSKHKQLQIKCFGNFEVFVGGEPLKFSYKKSKEALAYLVDREGSAINVSELNAVLWEEDHSSYLRNIIADIQNTLRKANVEDAFIKRYNECYIDVTKVDCDAYKYKKGDKDAIRQFRGEYMVQYDWAFFDGD